MEFRILGPVEARNADETVALGSEKQRSLLAILLLHANEVVSAEQLIDGLWGERPPPTALRTLQAHISRLRKALDHHAGAPVNDNGEPPLVHRMGRWSREGTGTCSGSRQASLTWTGSPACSSKDAKHWRQATLGRPPRSSARASTCAT